MIPIDVVNAYKEERYSFLFITDENNITPVDTLSDSTFLYFTGEEAIMEQHVSCLNIQRAVAPTTFRAVIDSTNAQGGFAVVNHPLRKNHYVYAGEIIDIEEIQYIEIFNGKSEKDLAHDNQMLWDSILSAGRLVYGIASDDFHEMKHISKGWIMVSSPQLQKDSIINAIKNGAFYSSTGVHFTELTVEDSTIIIAAENATKIVFIGNNRDTLQTSFSDTSSYRIDGNEGYIRVEASDNAGKKAWSQPLFWNKIFERNPYTGNESISIADSEWKLYPNPTTGILNIKSDITEKSSYTIYNLSGKIVLSGRIEISPHFTIDLLNIPEGIYILQLTNPFQAKTFKIVLL